MWLETIIVHSKPRKYKRDSKESLHKVEFFDLQNLIYVTKSGDSLLETSDFPDKNIDSHKLEEVRI